jgi:hypothetical protein
MFLGGSGTRVFNNRLNTVAGEGMFIAGDGVTTIMNTFEGITTAINHDGKASISGLNTFVSVTNTEINASALGEWAIGATVRIPNAKKYATYKADGTTVRDLIHVDTGGKSTLELDGQTLSLSNPATATTVGAAGGASALPATPTGYVRINIGATNYKIPYYTE